MFIYSHQHAVLFNAVLLPLVAFVLLYFVVESQQWQYIVKAMKISFLATLV